MNKFEQHTGIAAPYDQANIDTDLIIPKQFLQKVTRSGFGQHLFHEARFLDYEGTQENPDFILNQPIFRESSVLLARENFGCGSSREHAPWALEDYGFRAIIAPSFADIFYNNAINVGMVPVKLTTEQVDSLFKLVEANPGMQITVDLENQKVLAGELTYDFEIGEFQRHCLMNGLDSIGLTLQHEAQIAEYESRIPAWRR